MVSCDDLSEYMVVMILEVTTLCVHSVVKELSKLLFKSVKSFLTIECIRKSSRSRFGLFHIWLAFGFSSLLFTDFKLLTWS